MSLFITNLLGHYKVEAWDENIRDYIPTPLGLGMLVSVHDPDINKLLSRVRLIEDGILFPTLPKWNLGI